MLGDSHTRMEIYDADIMEKLLIHPGVSTGVKSMLQKYKKRSHDGNRVAVQYVYGKKMEQLQIGRLNVENSIGLAAFPRNIRCALAQTYYWDLDIENAHPVILSNLCKDNGWAYDKIEEFVKNRKDILNYIMTNEDKSRAEAKDICIAIFFGAYRDNHPCFEDLCKQISTIKDNCCGKYPDIYKLALKKVKETGLEWKDPKSSCLAITLQDIERKILLTIDAFLKPQGRAFETLIYDGGFIRKLSGESQFPIQLINDIEEHIKQTLKYDIKLSIKPCEHNFEFVSKESVFMKTVREFEKQHFYLKDSNLICEEDDSGIVHRWARLKAQEALGNKWKHEDKQFVCAWLDTANRRTYERVGFYPGSIHDSFIYNVYRGPIAAKAEGGSETDEAGVAAFKELIAVLMKRDEANVDYLTRWISHMFQRPEERVHTCIVFTGDMGLGKDMLWDFIGQQLCGSKLFFNSENHENDIFGSFNNQLEGRLLIKLEEVDGTFMRKNQSKLKAFITSSSQIINIKNVSTYSIDKYSRLVMTTNDAVPIVIDQTDRRFNIFHCGDERRGDLAWFKQTWDTMVAGRRGVYNWLMSQQLGDFNPSKIIKTHYHQLLAENEKPQQEVFIDNCIADINYDKSKRFAAELWKDYNIHCEEGGFQKCNVVHFIRKLSHYIEKGKIVKEPLLNGKARYSMITPAAAAPAGGPGLEVG